LYSESINKITRSTENVLEKFKAIDNSVKTVADEEVRIRSAIEEQHHGNEHILEVISSLNDITNQVKDGFANMLNGSHEVIQESRNLEQISLEITNGINEMARGADQINAAVTQVNDLSSQNRENITFLVNEVTRFKVD
jgi:methyl-accepting chemotaxis protein